MEKGELTEFLQDVSACSTVCYDPVRTSDGWTCVATLIYEGQLYTSEAGPCPTKKRSEGIAAKRLFDALYPRVKNALCLSCLGSLPRKHVWVDLENSKPSPSLLVSLKEEDRLYFVCSSLQQSSQMVAVEKLLKRFPPVCDMKHLVVNSFSPNAADFKLLFELHKSLLKNGRSHHVVVSGDRIFTEGLSVLKREFPEANLYVFGAHRQGGTLVGIH